MSGTSPVSRGSRSWLRRNACCTSTRRRVQICGANRGLKRLIIVRVVPATDPREALAAQLDAVRPRLVRALLAIRGVDGAQDAASEAIAWAWDHPDRLDEIDDLGAYLYRVALTRSAPRKRPELPPVDPSHLPDVEPALVPALLKLPERQRTAVWLIHACGWRYGEVAEALDISASAIGTHLSRGMSALRKELGVSTSEGATP